MPIKPKNKKAENEISKYIKTIVEINNGIFMKISNFLLVNLSIKNPLGKSAKTQLRGSRSNLLGQSVDLDFKEIQDADVVYYIANIKHGKEEHLKFSIQLQLSSESMEILEFRKKLYWGEE